MTHSKRAAILWPALALLAGLWLTAGVTPPVARAADAAQEEARRTIVLDVDGMTCDMCPITVRKALEKVPGVTEVEAKYEGDGRGWARVTFRPAAHQCRGADEGHGEGGLSFAAAHRR